MSNLFVFMAIAACVHIISVFLFMLLFLFWEERKFPRWIQLACLLVLMCVAVSGISLAFSVLSYLWPMVESNL